ncbi:MAG: cytochrome c family protein [Hyphomicrobiales bacterium]|nr:cytochrome c family protein [Hyphomicrobiales bacterium]
MRFWLMMFVAVAWHAPAVAEPELRGHGGPVRAIAITPDGQRAITGSFDQSAIVWQLDRGIALAVLRVHEGAVNAVAALPGGRFATAGEDGRIALWAGTGASAPERLLNVHKGPISALALSPDGHWIASSSWDSTVWLTPLGGGESRAFEGHPGNINGVAFSPDGHALISAGYDGTLRIWPLDGTAPRVVRLPTPLNALAVARDGTIAAGGADGSLFLLSGTGALRQQIEAAESPLIAVAFSPDGRTVAAASPRGAVVFFDTATGEKRFTLNGPGLPVWSLAFTPDGRQLLTGGGDRIVRRWDALNGEHLGPVVIERGVDFSAGLDGSRGAEVFKACAVCHALKAGEAPRAGPSLAGVMGRHIGTTPGYAYSGGFAAHDIVWSKETIARLFELGPSTYTPGTKMPEQKVISAEDRAALVDFIEKATRQP